MTHLTHQIPKQIARFKRTQQAIFPYYFFIQIGRQEGRQEDRHEAIMELAVRLSQNKKLTTEEIIEATGLSKEIVLALRSGKISN